MFKYHLGSLIVKLEFIFNYTVQCTNFDHQNINTISLNKCVSIIKKILTISILGLKTKIKNLWPNTIKIHGISSVPYISQSFHGLCEMMFPLLIRRYIPCSSAIFSAARTPATVAQHALWFRTIGANKNFLYIYQLFWQLLLRRFQAPDQIILLTEMFPSLIHNANDYFLPMAAEITL